MGGVMSVSDPVFRTINAIGSFRDASIRTKLLIVLLIEEDIDVVRAGRSGHHRVRLPVLLLCVPQGECGGRWDEQKNNGMPQQQQPTVKPSPAQTTCRPSDRPG
jgi:hypothetical protein